MNALEIQTTKYKQYGKMWKQIQEKSISLTATEMNKYYSSVDNLREKHNTNKITEPYEYLKKTWKYNVETIYMIDENEVKNTINGIRKKN